MPSTSGTTHHHFAELAREPGAAQALVHAASRAAGAPVQAGAGFTGDLTPGRQRRGLGWRELLPPTPVPPAALLSSSNPLHRRHCPCLAGPSQVLRLSVILSPATHLCPACVTRRTLTGPEAQESLCKGLGADSPSGGAQDLPLCSLPRRWGLAQVPVQGTLGNPSRQLLPCTRLHSRGWSWKPQEVTGVDCLAL